MSSWDRVHGPQSGQTEADQEEEESSEQKMAGLRMNVARQKRWVARKAERGGSADSDLPIQAKGELKGNDVHEVAEHGFSGGADRLPHGDKIQSAFGDHDVGGIKAAVGGKAAKASDALGAEAYASGDRVAFKGAPSLHTAAHEAAHVVQQRAGQGPAGGVGKSDDVYEKQADAIAGHVVAGMSAKPLLDQMTGGAKGGGGAQKRGPIQRMAGSTEGVQVQPGLPGAGGNYQGALDAQAQAGGFQRDANLNNADKVALEGELSGAIMRNLQAYGDVVYKVSRQVLEYIKIRDQEVQADMAKTIEKMVGEPPYYGRMGDDPTGKGPVYAAQLQTMLETGGGPVHQHIGAHGQFLANVYGKDVEVVKEQGRTLVRGKGKEIIDQMQGGAQALPPKELKDPAQQVELTGTQGGGANGGAVAQPFQDRGREPANPTAASVPQAQGIAPAGAGANVDVGPENQQSHQRGTEVWKTQENNLFLQHARLVLDMPMSGGGISGTTAELMQCARVMGVADKTELTQYGLACFGALGSAGAHSFHEVMTVVQQAGGNYTPGDYSVALSMIPDADKQRLMADPKFARILQPGAPGGNAPPAAAPAPAAAGSAAPPPGGGGGG
jgi:hypothetical protein